MGIPLAIGFDVNSPLALDSRDVATTIMARDAIASGRRFDGLRCYVVATNQNFQLQGGITNADWVEITASGGVVIPPSTGSASIVDEFGNAEITLRATIDEIIVEDENGVFWAVSATDSGELQIDSTLEVGVTDITLVKPGGTYVSLKIVDDTVITDVAGAGEIIAVCYLMSPSGLAWRLQVGSDNGLTLTVGYGNRLDVLDAAYNVLFQVKQTEDGVIHSSKPFIGSVPSTNADPSIVPWLFAVENGKNVMKVWDGTAYKSIALAEDIPVVNPDPFPVGMVMPSFLTKTEFLVEIGDPQGLRWKMCDGDGLKETDRLRIIKGWMGVPNGKGVTLRGLEDGTTGRDPDYLTRLGVAGANLGDKLGSYQDDEMKSHSHSITIWDNYYSGNSKVQSSGGSTQYSPGSTNPSGGNETRMKNMAVNFFTKYNR